MRPACYFILSLYVLPVTAWCQSAPTPRIIIDNTLTQPETNKLINNAFSSMVTSGTNAGEIGTYASVDPVNAVFLLKGSVPFGTGKGKYKGLSTVQKMLEDSSKFSYLSFSIGGNLIDKNYGQIFSGNSLNAGISIQAQYNFIFGTPHFKFVNGDVNSAKLQRDRLLDRFISSWRVDEMAYSDSAFLANQGLLQIQMEAAQVKLIKKLGNRNLLLASVGTPENLVADHPELADSLTGIEKDIASLRGSFNTLNSQLDSMQKARCYVLADLLASKKTNTENKLKTDYDSLTLKIPLAGFDLFWYTLIGGISKKGYSTFDATMPFSSQLAQNNLLAWNGGFAINYIHFDRLKSHTLFINASLSYLKDNNLSSLTTTEVDQTKKIVNAGGDTTRMITSKTNAYTSPVVTFLATNISTNFYYIFGKTTPSGVHVTTSVNFQDNGLNLANISASYILSFKNATKDQPVVNTELSLTFKDIFNQQHMAHGFWRRNLIGLSFAIPFNIFIP